MRMKSIRSVVLLSMLSAGTLAAQAPAPSRIPVARGGPNVVQLLLANTAQLQLNDQQVTRLAAIARRAESREQARRAAIDSMRARWTAPATDSATRAARRMQLANTLRATMERAREERHADLRDALAVLSADQQARAWELREAGSARPGVRARSAGRALRRGGAGGGMGRGSRRGVRPDMPRPR